MKLIKKILVTILFVFLSFFLFNAHALAKQVNVYVFYGQTCPHCKEAHSYLNGIKNKYDLNIIEYEVWNNEDNYYLMEEIADYLDVSATGVPFVIIDNTPIFGYSKGITDDIYKYHINLAKKNNFVDKVGIKLGIVPKEELKKINNNSNNDYLIKVPIVGNTNLKNSSLVLSSIFLGLIDGINPNTIWLILFLIIILIGVKDDKKAFKLVLSFVLSSTLIYLLFMISLFSLDNLASYITIARLLISLSAIVIGCIKLNSFSKLIDSKKESNNSKIKTMLKNNKYLLSVIGTILFGIISSLIRYSSANQASSLFIELLALNDLSGMNYYLYVIIYMVSFIVINLIIFGLFLILIKFSKINTKYYKYANLVSGLLTLLMSILILAKPELLMFN